MFDKADKGPSQDMAPSYNVEFIGSRTADINTSIKSPTVRGND